MDLRAGSLLKKVLWAAFALVLGASTNAQASPRSGVYSDVCIDPETQDQDGIELQWGPGPQPWITFVVCEGGCGARPVRDIKVSGDRISFTALDELVDGRGTPLPPVPYHYEGQFTANRLVLRSPGQRNFGREVLHRQPWKFRSAEAVARAGDAHVDDWPRPVRRCR